MTESNPTIPAKPRSANRGRLLFCLAALALCLPLQSCFTAGLWNSDLRDREKAYLTPLSLTLDVVTLPVQLAVVDGGHHHHRRCR